LTPSQFSQLSDRLGRPVFLAFDQDENQAGPAAAQQLARHLEGVGVKTHLVNLPPKHDPNSYFLAGATAADFAACLQGAKLQ